MNKSRIAFRDMYGEDISARVALHYGPVELKTQLVDDEVLNMYCLLNDNFDHKDVRSELLMDELIDTYPNQIVSVIHQAGNGFIREATFSRLPVNNSKVLMITFRVPE